MAVLRTQPWGWNLSKHKVHQVSNVERTWGVKHGNDGCSDSFLSSRNNNALFYDIRCISLFIVAFLCIQIYRWHTWFRLCEFSKGLPLFRFSPRSCWGGWSPTWRWMFLLRRRSLFTLLWRTNRKPFIPLWSTKPLQKCWARKRSVWLCSVPTATVRCICWMLAYTSLA